jgi:hypothetical protein
MAQFCHPNKSSAIAIYIALINYIMGSLATHSADNFAATTTAADEIAGTVARLAVVAAAVLHVEPVAGAGAVS